MTTGIYLRVERDGRWQALLVEELTDDERTEALKYEGRDELLRWLHSLCHVIRGASTTAQPICEDGPCGGAP